MFCINPQGLYSVPYFYFCFNVYKLDDLEKDSMPYFSVSVSCRKYHSGAQVISQFQLCKSHSQIFANRNILQILILKLYF